MTELKTETLNITSELQQQALMNILEDMQEDKQFLKNQRTAILNILEDLSQEQEQLKASRKQFQDLNSMLVALTTKTSIKGALDFLAWSLCTIAKFKKVTVLTPNKNRDLRCTSSAGFPKNWPLDKISISLKDKEDILIVSYFGEKLVAINNARSPDVMINNEIVEMLTLTSFLLIPLSMGGGGKSLVIADRGELLPFPPAEKAVFKTFTSQAESVLTKINLLAILETQKKKLEELDKLKDEFLNIAAHDLRTPATAIKGYISMILDGDAGEVSDKVREMLKDAYGGNERLINLVGDFLNVSRIEQGKIKIIPKAADLEKIVETSVKELTGLAQEKGLTLEYKKAKLPKVLADEERIIEVLNNLIGNAIKFTEKGGITISHEANKDEIVTHITDTGIGISQEAQKHLFEKFYRKSEHTAQVGLGLGLYICKLIIEGSGGKIWAKSEPGKGSTFSFSLPVVK